VVLRHCRLRGQGAGRIRQSAGAMAWINRALGGLFVYLGIRVAMLEAR
jgi:threonine/homoserine/homoserine lactone efflux protein